MIGETMKTATYICLSWLAIAAVWPTGSAAQAADTPFSSSEYREFARVMTRTAPLYADAYLQLQMAVAQTGLTMTRFEALRGAHPDDVDPEEKAALEQAQAAADAIERYLEGQIIAALKTSSLDLATLKAINDAYYSNEAVQLEIDQLMIEFSE